MPKKTFRMANPKKRRSKRKQSRRIKHIKGGVKGLMNITNLGLIWNYMFKQRAPNNMIIHELPTTTDGKKALFVIDMQNDFVDRYYDRKDPIEKHPVWQAKTPSNAAAPLADIFGGGNFAVAAGKEMIETMKTYVNDALQNRNYSSVVFSRDYHPVGHSSFNKTAFYESTLCGECKEFDTKDDQKCADDGGVFPAHCVQGKEGTKIITELESLIANIHNKITMRGSQSSAEDEVAMNKIKIVFKGIHQNCDSYTAVQKDHIDTIASNKASNKKNTNACGSVSGGYTLLIDGQPATATDALKFNEAFPAESELKVDMYMFKQEEYKYLDDVDVIEVCGLAGDYCVRDTVVALAQKYPAKIIVLLNDLTRYPVLPFGTISLIPHHKYLQNVEKLPDYKQELHRIKENMRMSILKEHLKIVKTKADITDYFILMDTKKRLLRPDEVAKVTAPGGDDPDYWVVLNDGDGLTRFPPPAPAHKPIGHFITPSQVIIDEYNKFANIKMYMESDPSIKDD